jgi:hypothetical protein
VRGACARAPRASVAPRAHSGPTFGRACTLGARAARASPCAGATCQLARAARAAPSRAGAAAMPPGPSSRAHRGSWLPTARQAHGIALLPVACRADAAAACAAAAVAGLFRARCGHTHAHGCAPRPRTAPPAKPPLRRCDYGGAARCRLSLHADRCAPRRRARQACWTCWSAPRWRARVRTHTL